MILVGLGVMAVLIITPIVSFNVGYNLGYLTGYDHGFENAQFEEIIQAGTSMPLSPGAEFRVQILVGRIGNYSVSGTIGFTVVPYLQANATAEVYIEHYPGTLFNTSYVQIGNTGFSFNVNATNHPTTIVVKANPLN